MVRNVLPLLEILCYLYGFAACYGQRMKYNISAVVFMIGEMVIMIGINDYGFPRYIISLSYMLMFLYCLFEYRDLITKTVVNCLLTFTLNGLLQLLCYMFISLLYQETHGHGVLTTELCVEICCFLMIQIVYKTRVLFQISGFLLQRNKLLIAIGVFVFLVLAGQVWMMKKNNFLQPDTIIESLYFIIILLILLWEWQKTQMEAEKEKAQREMNQLYYCAYENLIQSVREKQHDLKSHINAISGMLYTIGDYETLVAKQKEYFHMLTKEHEETTLLTMIENPLIAGFLTEKIHQAQQKQITVIWKCKLSGQLSGIPEYRLVEMMGIVIDNAVESALQTEEKKIWIELQKQNNMLEFAVVNLCRSEELGRYQRLFQSGYSSKGKSRGIGLFKLKRMIQEENGTISYSEEIRNGNPAVKVEFAMPVFS